MELLMTKSVIALIIGTILFVALYLDRRNDK